MADADDAAAAAAPGTLSVEIISPSTGIPVPLSFPALPAKTTVAQLKDMIRQHLTVPDPAAVDLRIIYQGKMLAPPDLTLEHAIGPDAIREGGKRVFHAVANTSARVPPVPYVAPISSPTSEQVQSLRRRHAAIHSQVLANQRARAAMHLNGIQDRAGRSTTTTTTSAATTTTTSSSAGDSPAQFQGGLPGAGTSATAQAVDTHLARLQSHLEALRSYQETHLWPASQPVQQPSPPQPQPTVSHGQVSGPEVYLLSSPEGPQAILVSNNGSTYLSQLPGQLSGVDLGSARARATATQPPGLEAEPGPVPAQRPLDETAEQVIERWRENGRRRHEAQVEAWRAYNQIMNTPQYRRIYNQLRVQRGFGRRAPGAVAGGLFAGHQPHGQAAGALAAAIWPHLWLMIRMGLFIYWFRFLHSESSWERWLSVIGIAVAVLLINTGMLNGVAEQAWQPVRDHLDRLMPMGPGAGARAGAAAGPQQRNNGPQLPPRPEEAAARMVAARREANANWLLDQVRRVERAGLLFLASIAPGVAERHIAQLEEEARAERRRQEEAAAAAAAAEAEAAAAAAAAAPAGETEGTGGEAPADASKVSAGNAPAEGASTVVQDASGGGDSAAGSGGDAAARGE